MFWTNPLKNSPYQRVAVVCICNSKRETVRVKTTNIQTVNKATVCALLTVIYLFSSLLYFFLFTVSLSCAANLISLIGGLKMRNQLKSCRRVVRLVPMVTNAAKTRQTPKVWSMMAWHGPTADRRLDVSRVNLIFHFPHSAGLSKYTLLTLNAFTMCVLVELFFFFFYAQITCTCL